MADSNGTVQHFNDSLDVAPGSVENPLVLSPGTIPEATEGTPYRQQFTASGGSGSGYTFSATGLPPGLTLDASGLLSGTPTSASGSPYHFVVAVADSNGTVQHFNDSLAVAPGSVESPLTLSPGTLPEATEGTPYRQQFTASGGSGSGYTFSATGLPPGLSLDASGLLAGTPTSASGSPYRFVVAVADSNGTVQHFNDSLAVAKAASESGGIVSSSPGIYYGQAVTLTATFSATAVGTAPMTGTVAFYDGSTYLGSAPMGVSGAVASFAYPAPSAVAGHANLTTSELSVGSHVIVAIYSGDANYSPASSESSVTVEVAPVTTSLTLAAVTSGQGTTLVATVSVTSPGAPSLSGNVSFYDGATLLGIASIVNGMASLPIGIVSPGPHAFTAAYSGSGTASAASAILSVDDVGPQVVGLSRYGFHDRATVLALDFDSALDPARAQDVSNYVITDAKGRRIAVASANYDATSHTVTLLPSTLLNIHRVYTLTVIGTGSTGLTGSDGTPLDGAGTGESGSNFTARLTWTALTVPGSPPAITFSDGQPHGYSGNFNRYVGSVVRATKAAAHSARESVTGGHAHKTAKTHEGKPKAHR